MSYAHLGTSDQERLFWAVAKAHGLETQLSRVRAIVEELTKSPDASRWSPVVMELEAQHGPEATRELWDKLSDAAPILPPEDTRTT